MGNLNSDMSGSEITATLDILSGEDGVTAEDMQFFRSFQWFREEIIESFKKGRRIYEEALGSPEKAIPAAATIARTAPVLLIEAVLRYAPFDSARLEILEIIGTAGETNIEAGTREHMIYDIAAGRYPCSRTVMLMAARKLTFGLENPSEHWFPPTFDGKTILGYVRQERLGGDRA